MLVCASQNLNITHVYALHFWTRSFLIENGICNLKHSSKNISNKLKVHLFYIPNICFNSQGWFIFEKVLCKTLFFFLIHSSPPVRKFTYQPWPLTSFISLPFGVLPQISSNLHFGNTYFVVSTTFPNLRSHFLRTTSTLSRLTATGLLQWNTS